MWRYGIVDCGKKDQTRSDDFAGLCNTIPVVRTHQGRDICRLVAGRHPASELFAGQNRNAMGHNGMILANHAKDGD